MSQFLQLELTNIDIFRQDTYWPEGPLWPHPHCFSSQELASPPAAFKFHICDGHH